MVVVTNEFWQGPAQKHLYMFQIVLKHVGFLNCAEGLYTMIVILAVRRSTKEVTSGVSVETCKKLSWQSECGAIYHLSR